MAPSVRVLMLNYEFPPYGGGTGLACASLLEHLPQDCGLEIDLVTSGPETAVEQRSDRPEFTLHRLAIKKRCLDYWTAKELATWSLRALTQANRMRTVRHYDLIHCWGGWPAGVVGAALPGRLPMLVSMRGSDVPGYNDRLARLDPLVFRPLVRWVWKRSNKLLAVSGDLRALALRTWPQAEIEVLPNAVRVAGSQTTELTLGQRLVFVGRLIPRKDVATLIDAAHSLAPQFPRLKVEIVGDGPLRSELEIRARNGPAADQIEFAGRLDRAGVEAALARADIFVLPSLQEAMSNAALEALGAGLAIVTTPTGVAELIDGNGTVIAVRDAMAVAQSLSDLCDNPQRLLAFRRRSHELAARYSQATLARRYNQLYGELAACRLAALRTQQVSSLSVMPTRYARHGTFQSALERGDPHVRL